MSDTTQEIKSASWYAIKCLPGKEKKLIDAIKENLETIDQGHKLHDYQYAQRGKQVSDKNFILGYILVKIEDDDTTLAFVCSKLQKNRMLGTGGLPKKISDAEVKKTLDNINQQKEQGKSPTFKIGDEVEILKGVFQSWRGIIDSIKEDKVEISVTIMEGASHTMIESKIEDLKLIRKL